MEPIPETSSALQEFGALLFEEDLLAEIARMSTQVREVVPECVGLSLANRERGVTFTVVAAPEEAAALDGVQYLDDGPCVTAVDEARPVEFVGHDVLDEEIWQLFARSTAAAGIASTLTLPILVEDTVTGSVNLYASTPNAFTGKHRKIADVLGTAPEGAIANADLGFSTRRAAQEAPKVLFQQARIQVAVGILASAQGVPASVARARLVDAARRAGVSETAIARLIIKQATTPSPPDEPGDDPAPYDHG